MASTWSRAAALRAARATIVMPSLFALTFKVFGNLQMALFAGFGSFATLVLVNFAGTARDKLEAHMGLAVTGSVLLVIGTLVSSTPVAAAVVTVPVTFAVFFLGVAGPNAANGVNGALLVYVLPAASPGTASMIPDRLAGWWLASVAGTLAVLALPTPSTGDAVRAAATRLGRALGDVLDAALHGEETEPLLATALERERALQSAFRAAPFRPTGLAIRDQALAQSVQLLEWCTALVADTVREQLSLRTAPPGERDLFQVSAQALRDIGDLFCDGSTRPDLDGLDARRKHRVASGQAGLTEPPGDDEDPRLAFHAHTIATAVLALGAHALVAARLADPREMSEARARWYGGAPAAIRGQLARVSGVAVSHASVRSIWFVNSLRGSLALAAAVAVAATTSVQHGFWVVLGTLSVLRTNAGATGATALRALVGTAIGFVVGGGLVIVIGTSGTALWIALPLAVLVASYAPGALPFTVGQAAFTVTVVILFNLLVPVGWKVGELRVEDVAIGCLVSVIVGSLFWPRGVAPLVGDDLADAYRTGVDYLRQAIGWVTGHETQVPTGGEAALVAYERLDEAVRGLLAEQGTKHLERAELWRLVGGTLRLRLTAHAVAGLPPACAKGPDAGMSIDEEVNALVSFYEELAQHVGRPARELTPLRQPELDGGAALEPAASRRSLWLQEHLDHLAEHLDELVTPAMHLAQIRRQPWWR